MHLMIFFSIIPSNLTQAFKQIASNHFETGKMIMNFSKARLNDDTNVTKKVLQYFLFLFSQCLHKRGSFICLKKCCSHNQIPSEINNEPKLLSVKHKLLMVAQGICFSYFFSILCIF